MWGARGVGRLQGSFGKVANPDPDVLVRSVLIFEEEEKIKARIRYLQRVGYNIQLKHLPLKSNFPSLFIGKSY